jgi:ubiquinone/menaquinone biosynthesis C-methylase UbiE
MTLSSDIEVCCPLCKGEMEQVKDGNGVICASCNESFKMVNGQIDYRVSASSNFHKGRSPQGQRNPRGERGLNHHNVLQANIELHDKIAHIYDTENNSLRLQRNPRVKMRIVEVLEYIKGEIRHPEALLDLGCGTGFVLTVSNNKFPIEIGLDASERILAVAQSKGFNVCLADVAKTPFKNNSFDVITANAILHHMYDPFYLIEEALRLLKPGGYFYSDFDPNYYFRKHVNPDSMGYRVLEKIYESIQRLRGGSVSRLGMGESLKGLEEKSEFHHAPSKGFQQEAFRRKLSLMGFDDILISLHGNSESIFSPRIPIDERIFAMVAKLSSGSFNCLLDFSLKSNACHFAILARKMKRK